MYLKFGDSFHDYDMEFLRDLFALFDERLKTLQQQIDECFTPDQMGLFDETEHLAGMGFVACQRYLASTYGQHDIQKDAALRLGPKHDGGEPVARILNAAANYWKHVAEWDTSATIARDAKRLKNQQQRTIHLIETVTPWCDYTCANLLCELTSKSRLTDLLPTLEAWRGQLDATCVE